MPGWQFFWDVMLVGVLILIAARVGAFLDRDQRVSVPVKWAILTGLVVAGALFLALYRRVASL
ncbi:MAG: hypothetical protein JSU87_11665 [Gemmatimonadota bacterium]|nr:MAG: hypothetical protein JSU87_11665 [Gemmatimonadota bacterium]